MDREEPFSILPSWCLWRRSLIDSPEKKERRRVMSCSYGNNHAEKGSDDKSFFSRRAFLTSLDWIKSIDSLHHEIGSSLLSGYSYSWKRRSLPGCKDCLLFLRRHPDNVSSVLVTRKKEVLSILPSQNKENSAAASGMKEHHLLRREQRTGSSSSSYFEWRQINRWLRVWFLIEWNFPPLEMTSRRISSDSVSMQWQ